MKDVVPSENVYFVTNEGYFNVLNQIKEIYPDFLEPGSQGAGKAQDTMPAIVLAAKYLCSDKIGIDETAPIIMSPSDHYIGDKKT